MHLHQVCRRHQTEGVGNSGAEEPGNEATIFVYYSTTHLSLSLQGQEKEAFQSIQFKYVRFTCMHEDNLMNEMF